MNLKLLILVAAALLPVDLAAQVVFPDEQAIWYYKDTDSRVRPFAIQQKTLVPGTDDTLYVSSGDFTEVRDFGSFAKIGVLSTGFPLGNNLVKHSEGYWSSTLSDTTPLIWWFENPDSTNWVVYADSVNEIRCVYQGNEQLNHFSRLLTVRSYRFKVTGTTHLWLHNQRILCSDYGILYAPDLRRWPDKAFELRLTGYTSASEKLGLYFTDTTFAPQQVNDTIALSQTEVSPFTLSPVQTYKVNRLFFFAGNTPSHSKWISDVTVYPLSSTGAVQNPSYLWSQNLHLPRVPVQNGLIPGLANGLVYLIFDSLPLQENPDYTGFRTRIVAYGGNHQAYIYGCNGSSASDGHYAASWRSGWGYISSLRTAKRLNSCYNRLTENCLFLNLGGRTLYGPMVLSDPQTSMESSITAYPNPVQDELYLDMETSSTAEVYHLELYDSRGRLVYGKSQALPGKLNVEQLNSGLYLLKIRDHQGREITKKLVKN